MHHLPKAKKWLQEQGIRVEEIDLNQGLSEAQIDTLIGTRDYKQFLNFRNELYRERKMKLNPPPRAEAIASCAAWFTASTFMPSTWCPGIPKGAPRL